MIDKSIREVRFGEISLETSLSLEQLDMKSSNLAGVQIVTDDPRLYQNILIATAGDKIQLPTNHKLVLYYITKDNIPLYDELGNPLVKTMTPNDKGELYMSYDMQTFGFAGDGLFGIASSLAYGIRSFDLIESGIIGLHSSCIYDKERKKCFLLTGDGTLGKSSVVKMIEQEQPERFEMISDDWCEFDFSTGLIHPISTVYSNKLEVESSENFRFESFGKKFFRRDGQLPLGMELGGIIEILPGGYSLSSSPETFVKISMSHIPFMGSSDISRNSISQLHSGNAQTHLIQLINRRQQVYFEYYKALRSSKLIGRIINDKEEAFTLNSLKSYILDQILNFNS